MNKPANFAIIGAGAMAEAIISGMLNEKLTPADQIVAAEPRPERRTALAEKYGIVTTADNLEAVKNAGVVLLSVKPQILPQVMATLKGKIPPAALIISIVAGASIEAIQTGLNHTRLVRVMPNTPAQTGSGMSVWNASPGLPEEQKVLAKSVLASLGKEYYVEDEKYLDMATAVSGSGPAYVFLFLEALIDAGVQIGMSRPMAELLAAQTISGSIEYFVKSGTHPAQLRNQVTSPAGTTAAALYELENGGLRTAVTNAVLAAYQRCLELGK